MRRSKAPPSTSQNRLSGEALGAPTPESRKRGQEQRAGDRASSEATRLPHAEGGTITPKRRLAQPSPPELTGTEQPSCWTE
eukprot:2575191-Pyramimonas_sp.AAC.1